MGSTDILLVLQCLVDCNNICWWHTQAEGANFIAQTVSGSTSARTE
ncbi:hypothetical protein M3J09_001455 [Ascochyta lentis]